MKRLPRLLTGAVVLLLFTCGLLRSESVIDLTGEWSVSLSDPIGEPQWKGIHLPGTLDDAGFGEAVKAEPELTMATLARLQRKVRHVGPAWYRREVVIPEAWLGEQIRLHLGRVLWESRVYVDGVEVSRANSLSVAQTHDLTAALKPGRHSLVLRIDNSEIFAGISHHAKSYPSPDDAPLAHAYTNHTQVMWNGVLGELTLRAEPAGNIAALRVDAALGPVPKLGLTLTMANRAAPSSVYRLVLRKVSDGAILQERETAASEDGRIEWTLTSTQGLIAWDEFSPELYEVTVTDQQHPRITRSARFGFRELLSRQAELSLNGQRIYLRGTLECSVFPLKGYPPMEKEAWKEIMVTVKNWGLNHLRFHSWCPPGAAFEAADELGLYLQVELPHWSLEVGARVETEAYLREEADRILREYGNHPSFMLFSLGNELQGDMAQLNREVRRLKEQDSRRLYTATTFTFEKGHGREPEPEDQFFVTQYTENGWIRGQGIFNESVPSFEKDYDEAARAIQVPLIAHEIGQYSVFPDLSEIDRYTGNLVPLNFMAVKRDLERKGLLDLAPQFTRASGQFAALLYKEEIERALRTRTFDGFQILGLQDFPGQGTALVGMLNAFWKTKGFIDPEEFRQFAGAVVPLARMPRATYETGEVLSATVEIANFGRELRNRDVVWTLSRKEGPVVAEGGFASVDMPSGTTSRVGEVRVSLPELARAEVLTLQVSIRGTEYRNHWKVWVYPKYHYKEGKEATEVIVARSFEEAEAALNEGKRVLFLPELDALKGIKGQFVPVFWSPVHFPNQPGTMGLLCDPSHAALREFPTDSHSDWQWWDLNLRSKVLVLDGLRVTPIVRVIDNFNRNHSLATLFEVKVGTGRLLVCSIDLFHDLEKRATARQLRASLIQYIESDDFAPERSMSGAELRAALFP